MKNNVYKIIIVFIIIVIIVAISTLVNQREQKSKYDLVRIHIRANSDSTYDQTLKYKVRNRLIEIITPLMQEAQSKKEALNIFKANLEHIQLEATEVLISSGASYQSIVLITKEEFPTRKYGDLIFERGIYDALIVNLGSAEGENWWCVAFPPLCFVPERDSEIRYKSKIIEIIKKAKK